MNLRRWPQTSQLCVQRLIIVISFSTHSKITVRNHVSFLDSLDAKLSVFALKGTDFIVFHRFEN